MGIETEDLIAQLHVPEFELPRAVWELKPYTAKDIEGAINLNSHVQYGN